MTEVNRTKLVVMDTLITATTVFREVSKFVDLRLISSDEQYFDAHKLILSSHCEYFRTYFGFWEALEGRSSTNNVHRLPFEGVTVGNLLKYLYRCAVPETQLNQRQIEDTIDLLLAIQYVAADKHFEENLIRFLISRIRTSEDFCVVLKANDMNVCSDYLENMLVTKFWQDLVFLPGCLECFTDYPTRFVEKLRDSYIYQTNTHFGIEPAVFRRYLALWAETNKVPDLIHSRRPRRSKIRKHWCFITAMTRPYQFRPEVIAGPDIILPQPAEKVLQLAGCYAIGTAQQSIPADAAIIFHEGDLFCFGGRKAEYLIVPGAIDLSPPKVEDKAFRYHEGRWEALATLPWPVFGAAGCLLNGKMYILGGRQYFAGEAIKKCAVYDPATNNWASVADLPMALCYHAAVMDSTNEGILIISGGCRGKAKTVNHSKRVFKWNPRTGYVQYLPDMIEPRIRHRMIEAGNYLFVFGGVVDRIGMRPARREMLRLGDDRFEPAALTIARRKRVIYFRCVAGYHDGNYLYMAYTAPIGGTRKLFVDRIKVDPTHPPEEWVVKGERVLSLPAFGIRVLDPLMAPLAIRTSEMKDYKITLRRRNVLTVDLNARGNAGGETTDSAVDSSASEGGVAPGMDALFVFPV